MSWLKAWREMQIVASTLQPQKDGVVGLRWYDRRENPDNLIDERNGGRQVYTARVSVTR